MNYVHIVKKSVMISIVYLVLSGMISCNVYAHPASDMTLTYNHEERLLTVSITHLVSDRQTHYIDEIIISKNDEFYNSYTYSSQPTNSSFAYHYEVQASIGDRIEVRSDCNLGGSLIKQLTITSGNTTRDSTPLTLRGIASYPILGMPLNLLLGVFALFFFLLSAGFALLKRRGKIKSSFKWHFKLSYIALILGIIHGTLGLLTYL